MIPSSEGNRARQIFGGSAGPAPVARDAYELNIRSQRPVKAISFEEEEDARDAYLLAAVKTGLCRLYPAAFILLIEMARGAKSLDDGRQKILIIHADEDALVDLVGLDRGAVVKCKKFLVAVGCISKLRRDKFHLHGIAEWSLEKFPGGNISDWLKSVKPSQGARPEQLTRSLPEAPMLPLSNINPPLKVSPYNPLPNPPRNSFDDDDERVRLLRIEKVGEDDIAKILPLASLDQIQGWLRHFESHPPNKNRRGYLVQMLFRGNHAPAPSSAGTRTDPSETLRMLRSLRGARP